MSRQAFMLVACLGLFCAAGFAGEKGGEKKENKPPAAPKEEFTLTGKLTKEEKKVKGKDGAEKSVTTFTLTDAQGVKTVLPPPKADAAHPTPVDLAAFIDKTIVAECSGTKSTKQVEGKEVTQYKVVTVKTVKEQGS